MKTLRYLMLIIFTNTALNAQYFFPADLDLSLLQPVHGLRIQGISAGDYLGTSLSGARDVNGDGLMDVIIGAPRAANDAGQSYVIFGSSNGVMGGIIELSQLTGAIGSQFTGTSREHSGYSVSEAGDFNGDGWKDLIIGAPAASRLGIGNNVGKSYVIFGSSNGVNNLNLSSLNGTNGLEIIGFANESYTGYSVSDAGDLNKDGLADLIIGAPYAVIGGQSYVIFGTTNISSPLDVNSINGSNGFRIGGFERYDKLGFSVSGIDDFNGDQIDDVIIGAPDAGNNDIGQCYVVFGSTNPWPSTFNLSSLNGLNGFNITGNSTNDSIGKSVSKAGDVNGDGLTDIIVGDPDANANKLNNSGQAFVVFGASNVVGGNLNVSFLNGTNGFRINGRFVSGNAGASVSSAGDMSGDGVDDVIIGAPNADPNGIGSGESYVIFGKTNSFVSNLDVWQLNGNDGFRIWGVTPDHLGNSVSGIGDFNGDQIDDVIIGASQARPHGTVSGQSYILFGREVTNVLSTKSLADFNGDGRDDILFKRGRNLSILTRSGVGTNFNITSLSSTLNSGQKVAAANDITDDNRPEIFLKQGKKLSVVTVASNLTFSATLIPLPIFQKKFKVVASGRIGTNTAIVTSKGKRITIYSDSLSITRTNATRHKVVGLSFNGSVNPSTLFLLGPGRALKQLPINVTSNSLILGKITPLKTLPKGFKPVGVGKILNTNQADVILQKRRTISILMPPAYSKPVTISTVDKGQKGVGPK